MAEPQLKSHVFRREREVSWRELEGLLGRAERRGGIRNLDLAELIRLPMLYFASLSSLSVARNISLDHNLLAYLESLSSRAYLMVYGVRANFWGSVAEFFRYRLPQAVRGIWPAVLLSLLALSAGTVAGYGLTISNSDWFYSFVDPELASGRTPTASTESLREVLFERADTSDVEELSVFSTFLFTHNARIGMMCFALGFALGLPTLFLLIQTGLMIGAFIALYDSRGLGVDIVGWLMIHGVTELGAIVLCGAAGLMLGYAIAFPGAQSRLANLALHGRRAAMVVMGAVFMLLIAGILEGLGRQLIDDTNTRLTIAGATLLIWVGYYVTGGRSRRAADGDNS
ncbi:MAG TPA: stage II sporulation protein M [Verrucomicrobiae bacterium]|nr:stage II sporulation protein M [Verrucomicrobiae bacterium]